jgi:DNA-binding transcriptional MerR regulator
MESRRHPVTDIIQDKIIKAIQEARDKGLTLENIALICDLNQPLLTGLLKQPGEYGYRGSRMTLNTVIKLWTGLGKPLSELFEDVVNVEPAGKIVNVVEILETDKQVLEFDLKVMSTILSRRAVTPKKLAQIKELMVGVEKLIASVNQALDKLKEYQASLEAANQPPQTSPAPPPSRKKTRKG